MTDQRTEELRRALVASEMASSPGTTESAASLESTVPSGAALPRDNMVLARADAALTPRPATKTSRATTIIARSPCSTRTPSPRSPSFRRAARLC